MKVLRIKLTQNQASYTREETVNNRMTYPLPSYSTIIGALHNACGYTSYHEMDVSVQGKYRSMQKEVYVNHALLNNCQDDRNILIWLPNPKSLSGGYVTVAEAEKAQGNSFRKGVTVQIYNDEKIKEYRALKDKAEKMKCFLKSVVKVSEIKWKEEEAKLKREIEKAGKKSEIGQRVDEKIRQGEERIRTLKSDYEKKNYEEYEEPMSHFQTLTKGPQMQEVLYDVELVIHVKAGDDVLADILRHQNDFVSLGRSEDFIDLKEMKMVELTNKIDDDHYLPAGYSIYVNADKVRLDAGDVGKGYYLTSHGKKLPAKGTVYYVSKDYVIDQGKRKFNKIPCLYSSYITISGDSCNILWDAVGDNNGDGYIVDLN